MNLAMRAIGIADDFLSAVLRLENPVITRELRTRMRAGRAHWAMLSYVIVLSVVVFGVYYFTVWLTAITSGGAINWSGRQVGREMFIFLTWFQMGLLALAGPSLTSGSLTMEIQQQTMELLSLTALTPRNIIVGKAGAAALFLWMLLFSSFPLAGICLVFGGISPAEIFVTYLLLAVWVFLYSAIGVFWSSLVTRTSTATLLTYVTGIGYAMSVTGFGGMAFGDPGSGVDSPLGMLNPGWAPYGALGSAHVFGMPMPYALVSLIVNGAGAILLLAAAESHLKYHRPDKAFAVRSLLLGLSVFTLVMWFSTMPGLYSAMIGSYSSTSRIAAGVMITIVALVFSFIPAFSTGAVQRARDAGNLFRYLISGFQPRRLFSQDLAGGSAFVLLWFVVCAAVGLISLILTPSPSFPVIKHPAHFGAMAMVAGYLKLAIAMVFVTIGYCSMGILASVISPSRNLAMIVTLAFVILTHVFYLIPITAHSRVSPIYELAYVWPVLPIVSYIHSYTPGSLGPRLLIHPSLHWLAVALCYAVISLVLLLIASCCLHRCKGVADE